MRALKKLLSFSRSARESPGWFVQVTTTYCVAPAWGDPRCARMTEERATLPRLLLGVCPLTGGLRRRKVRSTPLPPCGESCVHSLAPPFRTRSASLGSRPRRGNLREDDGGNGDPSASTVGRALRLLGGFHGVLRTPLNDGDFGSPRPLSGAPPSSGDPTGYWRTPLNDGKPRVSASTARVTPCVRSYCARCALCSISWAAMLIAISSGVSASISSPMGLTMRSMSAWLTPAAARRSFVAATLLRLPMQPT